MSVRLESKELDRKEEDRKIEEADKILKKEGKEDGADKKDPSKDIADVAAKAGNSLYADISSTRKDEIGSGGISEKAEFQEKAKPLVDKYEAEVRQASLIEDPEQRKKAIEKAYFALREELEGIKGTQEGRDAQNDKNRDNDAKKTAEEKERDRTLKFSEAILKASKEIEVDRRLADIERRVKERTEMSQRTLQESMKTAGEAKESLSAIV
ncbi:MAG: hypothetical protein QMC36_01930 [Patescibacteria group bacterium]